MTRPCVRFAGALSLVLLQGCGWAFVKGPPPNHAEMRGFTCTQSRAMPALDVAWGAAWLGLMAMGGALSEDAVGTAVAFGVVGGGLAAGSAATGFRRVARCRAALAEREARLRAAAEGSR